MTDQIRNYLDAIEYAIWHDLQFAKSHDGKTMQLHGHGTLHEGL